MIDIQEFALDISLTKAPDNWVEVNQLRKYWRANGVKELFKVFKQGESVLYDKEIDWKKISTYKKNCWYEEQELNQLKTQYYGNSER